MGSRRRSVPGQQLSIDPSATSYRCMKCKGKEPAVYFCGTCGATGVVTSLAAPPKPAPELVGTRGDLKVWRQDDGKLLIGRPPLKGRVQISPNELQWLGQLAKPGLESGDQTRPTAASPPSSP